jgi:6-phosphofructokinase 1
MSLPEFPNAPVAVLFSGGDAPGMNACLRAIVRLGLNRHAIPIFGIRDGYGGLVRAATAAASDEGLASLRTAIVSHRGAGGLLRKKQDVIWMDHNAVTGQVDRGGTILGSSRCKEFEHDPAVRQRVITFLQSLGIRALIVCGGNGSLAGAQCLKNEGGLQVVGIPATIDNDLLITEMALGVDTAVRTVVDAVHHCKDTARSHRRIIILETMGRDSGELAVLAAIASGAEFVIPPRGDRRLTEADIAKLATGFIQSIEERNHAIVLIAEGVRFDPPPSPDHEKKPAVVFSTRLKRYLKAQRPADAPEIEVRESVLGHMQRGGSPTPPERLLAALFAECALKAIVQTQDSGVTAQRQGRVAFVPFDAAPPPGRQEHAAALLGLQEALSDWR